MNFFSKIYIYILILILLESHHQQQFEMEFVQIDLILKNLSTKISISPVIDFLLFHQTSFTTLPSNFDDTL